MSFGTVDAELASDILGLFKEINRQGTTVVICTHDKELIRRFGGRVVELQDGKLKDKGGA